MKGKKRSIDDWEVESMLAFMNGWIQIWSNGIGLTLFLYLTLLSSMLAQFSAIFFFQCGGKDVCQLSQACIWSPKKKNSMFPVSPGKLPGMAFIVLA